MTPLFRSGLAARFNHFVALKRATGFDYRTQEHLLAKFDRYITEHAPDLPLQRETVITFLASLEHLSPRARDNVITVVWQALRSARQHGAPIAWLPARPPCTPSSFRLTAPRLICHEEICAILAAARQLLPAHHLRPATYATLYGLLFVTGLRISEALALNVGDFNASAGLLDVRCGKFGKQRILPLQASTVAALKRYVDDPRRHIARTPTSPLFVSGRRRRLSHPSADRTFKGLSAAASIAAPWPSLHDIRHSFAVLSVLRWYRESTDVNARLPALSSYLGHVSIDNTRVYLQANGLLLEQASQRFGNKTAKLDEVLS